MVLLPPLLTVCLIAWDRLVRRRRGSIRAPVHAGWLLGLAVVGVWSHPLLDLLNTYGVRLLMPFSERWYYGDTLFIIDPWLWLSLATGVLLARRRGRLVGAGDRSGGPALTAETRRRDAGESRDARWATRPARIALGAFVTYALVMAISSRVGRRIVAGLATPMRAERTMVAPVPLTPLRRQVVRAVGDDYEVGVLAWTPAPSYARLSVASSGRNGPGASAAARTADGAAFLSWARFPRFTSERIGDSLRVHISDLRYADERGRGWASVVVTVPAERQELP
jgi:inner membrane protein